MPDLKFVSAEEAATWPEGVPVICAQSRPGVPSYATGLWLGVPPEEFGWSHFARLPDTLPEIERHDP